MIDNTKLDNNIMKNLVNYIQTLSLHDIEDISKIVNKEKRKKFPYKKNKLYEGNQKDIKSKDFKVFIQNINDERFKLAFKIMYYMGLRISEVVEIQKKHISSNWILQIQNIKCKRIDKLIVPIRLRDEIKDFIKNNDKDIINNENFLFYSNNPVQKRNNISPDYLRRYFMNKTIELKINKVYAISKDNRNLYIYSTHSLRHAYAKRFYEKSQYDIEKTRQALRHRKITDTQTYIQDNIQDVYRILEHI